MIRGGDPVSDDDEPDGEPDDEQNGALRDEQGDDGEPDDAVLADDVADKTRRPRKKAYRPSGEWFS